MSADLAIKESIYIKHDEEEDTIHILEAAHITDETYNKFRYVFQPGADITESLKKRTDSAPVSATKNGRTGYSSMTCEYPDKTTSGQIFIRGCIFQYRQTVDRDNADYGTRYVCLGIPQAFVGKIMSDAKTTAGINVGAKHNVQKKEGYYWFNANIDALKEDASWVVIDLNGEPTGFNFSVKEVLSGQKKNMLADVKITMSATMSTETMEERLELKSGMYSLSVKPTEVYFKDATPVEGPVLNGVQQRKMESMAPTDVFVASPLMAAFVNSRIAASRA